MEITGIHKFLEEKFSDVNEAKIFDGSSGDWNYLVKINSLKSNDVTNKMNRTKAEEWVKANDLENEDIAINSSNPKSAIKKAIKNRGYSEYFIIWRDEDDFTEEAYGL